MPCRIRLTDCVQWAPGHAVSEQKIPLRHRQHRRRLAGQQHAVGADLVGLRIDFDMWCQVVEDHRFLRDAARSRCIAGPDPACTLRCRDLRQHAPFLPLFAPANSSAIGLNLRGWPGPTEESTVSRRSRAAQAFHRQGLHKQKRAGGITGAFRLLFRFT